MILNKERIGNFTSSEIYNLTKKDRSGKSFGKPALDYIEETNMERRLGRSLTDESNARPLVWGKLLEPIAFSRLDFEYDLCSSESLVHPEIPYWAGSPDLIGLGKVGDIKCPITLKSFCKLVDQKDIEGVRANHPDGEKYYWQLVSNAILLGVDCAELIVFMPYESELNEVKLTALDYEGGYWVANAKENELPYLIDGGYYKNVNRIFFPVPQSDKDLLTECVLRAGELLI